MKCSRCQSDNPQEAKFCTECGARIEFHCPKCGAITPAVGKFCKECGYDLRESKPPPAIDYSQPISYTPKHLADKILAVRPSVEGERKQVTVLFADVKDFTSISEKLDPEEVQTLIRECLAFFTEEIHRYEGTIAQFLGDGVMALFGAPIAHEDAPQRALYAALSIRERLTEYSDKLKKQGIDFNMRIGLNTGLVVVGRIGDDLTMEYTAMGDTVNLASRMESTAEPGTIQVAENTYRLTEGYFEFKPLGEIQVKGKKEPVKAYQLIKVGPVRTKLGASMVHGLTPFVGRERELELLLDGFNRAKSGRGQAFSIVGEAGVGKSRLLYEFKKAIAQEDITFLEGRCLSYSRGEAYHPVIDMLKANFNLMEGDRDHKIRDKVKKGLKALGVDETYTLPYLLELLSVRDSGIDNIQMSPEARRDRIKETVKRIVLKGSEMRPLVMAVEDLQWIDKSTEEMAKYMLDSIPAAQVLLIFTYRPDYVHTWGGRSYHSQVTLNRLSNRESLAMVTNILGTENIDRKLEELILEKTEGIPFFIEEFIKSLKDLGIIEIKDSVFCLAKDMADVTIPSTIQDVIMARVDSLPDVAKAVLQTGSVIEREFSYELIKRLMRMSEQELLSHLSALRDSELLYERGIYPKSTYIFKHALTREVVYDSILTAKKKKLHVETGGAIEEICKDNLDEHYAVLAEHYMAGGNYEKGTEYCRHIVRKVQKAASFHDAIIYGEKMICCLERLPQTEDILGKIVDTKTALGLFHLQLNHYTKAKEAVEPIVDLALKLGNKRRLSQIYTIIGNYSALVEDDFPTASKYLEEASKIAEEQNDSLSTVTSNVWLGIIMGFNCQYDRAIHSLRKSLEINVAANVLWGISTVKSIMSAWCYNYQGKIHLGYESSEEAMQIAESSGDIYSQAHAYTYHGFSCFCKGQFIEAERFLRNAIDLSSSINLVLISMLAYHWGSDTYYYMGEYRKSEDCLRKLLDLLEQERVSPSLQNLGRMGLARAKVMNNEMDIDLPTLYRYATSNKVRAHEGWMSRCLVEILLNIDEKHLPEAEVWIKKAIASDIKNGMLFSLANDHAVYAELLKREGNRSEAKENLNKAIDIFKECGADGWVKKYEDELTKI